MTEASPLTLGDVYTRAVEEQRQQRKAMSKEFALVDLSSIAYPIWHMSQKEPDPNHTSTAIVAKVRSIASNRPHLAICLDKGKSFRKAIDGEYKATRPEHDATLHHQINLAIEILQKDKFPVWAQDGYEADDVIASATAQLLARNEADTVRVFTADKDLLQLVGPRVVAQSVRDDKVLGEKEVIEKYGLPPNQMRDYLSLVGDTSDNVKGAKGVGPVKALELLKAYGTIDLMLGALQMQPSSFKPALATSLKEFQPRATQVQALITLRVDAKLPLAEIDKERVPEDVASFGDDTFNVDELEEEPDVITEDLKEAMPTLPVPAVPPTPVAQVPSPGGAGPETAPATPAAPLAPSTPQEAAPAAPLRGSPATVVPRPSAVSPTPASPPVAPKKQEALQKTDPPSNALVGEVVSGPFEMQLEPQNLVAAQTLAKWMFESRLFSAYGTPQGVLATIMAGREFGLQAHASLRGFHIIEGKQTMAADLIRALVLRRKDVCKYFRCVERSEKAAAFETWREGDPQAITLRYTFEEAMAAGVVKAGSGWTKNPADMLVARAGAKLARLVYPDIMFGVYAREEFD